MELLRWTWDKINSDIIWAEPCYGCKFTVKRKEETWFTCGIPKGLENVRSLELKYKNSIEAKKYCSEIWQSHGYMIIREVLRSQQEIPEKEKMVLDALYQKAILSWVKK